MDNKNIIIITGNSGSGKSTAIAAFEDSGFFCVDNMPVRLLPDFFELPVAQASEYAGYVFVMDLREKGFLYKYTPVFEELTKKGYTIEILFLEADETVLLQRYSQTRRHHPLSSNGNLLDGIRVEKKQLNRLKHEAKRVINTSRFNVHELKSIITGFARRKTTKVTTLAINVLSFGFKFGVPPYADLMVDVRFLPNPYFVPELRPLDGTDKKIKDFVLIKTETRTFLEKYIDLLDYLLPLYEKEGKAYLSIAVGCTGGRHRSVVLAAAIYDHIKSLDKQVKITHRDIGHPVSD
ncbi:MAG: RNase adapter RapZ [Desulfobacteraceae bacterium]|nr:RNase adapter RapZ [Desulfobacteraceae bacterium]